MQGRNDSTKIESDKDNRVLILHLSVWTQIIHFRQSEIDIIFSYGLVSFIFLSSKWFHKISPIGYISELGVGILGHVKRIKHVILGLIINLTFLEKICKKKFSIFLKKFLKYFGKYSCLNNKILSCLEAVISLWITIKTKIKTV